MMVYLVVAIFIFIFISYQYRIINKSIILTPISMAHMTFSISIVTVIFLYNEGYIPDDDFFILLFQQLIFMIFIVIAPFFINKLNYNFLRCLDFKKIDFQLLNIIVLISVIISLIYSVMLWGNYSTGDDRLLLNKNLRFLSILKDLFVIWAVGLLSFSYCKTKKKKYLLMFILLMLLITFSGSKSGLLSAGMIFIFFYLQLNSINGKIMIKFYILLLVFLIFPSLIMSGTDFLEKILTRIYMSADIYLFSYVIGDYKDLINFYDPLSYLLHPFSSIFGIRGYEYPLGAQILSTANLPVTGTGPNSHMTILNMIFFHDCTFCIILASFMYGIIALLTVWFAFYFLTVKYINSYFKILVFIILYTNQINLFLDIGMFEFNIIMIIIGFFIYLIFELLNKKYRRIDVRTN